VSAPDRDRLREIRTFPSLVEYLRDELGWPIDSDDFGNLVFEYEAEELGIDTRTAVKIDEIKQLRPLAPGQPWGIFFMKFAPKRLPVSALRRILRAFVRRKRHEASAARRAAWPLEDLLFICSHKQEAEDAITFVHFVQPAVRGRAARLTSFGWTQDSHNRTVLEFNLPPLRWPGNTADASGWRTQWLRAFDKQRLTEVFFREYKGLFKDLEADLRGQTSDHRWAHDYALQFLNRCMFLYFIQRKRWLGGDADFLRTFWQAYGNSGRPRNTFFQEWLRVLFFEAFNNRFHGGHRHFPQDIQEALALAPFLNGGLFSENDVDREHDVTVSDARFEQVFNFFERYNFTITEDSPLDQEVAVDPEMIGKVYESLVNVSEEADERGDAGIFYTPRTEIDLMCRLALVDNLANHLGAKHKSLLYEAVLAFEPEDKDQADGALAKAGLWPALDQHLRGIAVADPACGSGSFLVGMLHVLDDLQQRADKHLSREEAPYDRRKRIIGQNLFGVDVMEWACHVAELRLWLALIIDADFSPEQLHVRREPLLPHFSFKVRAGDSLVQEVGGVNLAHRRGSLDIPKPVKDRLRKLQNAKLAFYDNEPDPKLKTESAIRNEEVSIFRDLLDYRAKALGDEAKSLMRLQAQEISQQVNLLTGKKEGPSPQLSLARQQREQRIAALKEEAEQVEAEREALRHPKDVPFVWDIGFAEVVEGEAGGFDIVIGNPPYVNDENIGDPQVPPEQVRAEGKRAYRAKLARSVYQVWPRFFGYQATDDRAERKMDAKSDLYIYFYFYGLSLLNDEGSFCFITSNSWLDAGYGKDLQEFLVKYCHIKMVLENEAKRVFSADINAVIVLLSAPDDRREEGLSRQARFVTFRVPFEEVISPIIFEEVEEACERRSTGEYRVCCLAQKRLLEEGCDAPDEDEDEEGAGERRRRLGKGLLVKVGRYVGGKWGGKYLRAPDVYHKLVELVGKKLVVPLGAVCGVQLGVITGANAFFYLTVLSQSRGLARCRTAQGEQVEVEEEYLRPILRGTESCNAPWLETGPMRIALFYCNSEPQQLVGTKAWQYILQGEQREVLVKQGREKGRYVTGFHTLRFFAGRRLWYAVGARDTADLVCTKAVGDSHKIGILREECLFDQRFYGLRSLERRLTWRTTLALFSSVWVLFRELYGRCSLGGGALDISTADMRRTLIPSPAMLPSEGDCKSLLQALRGRGWKTVAEEVQSSDRRRIDDVCFDSLGLTSGEREAVYEAVVNLVQARLSKAGSM